MINMKKYKVFDESFEDKNSDQISHLSELNADFHSNLKGQNMIMDNKNDKNFNKIESQQQPQNKKEVRILFSNDKQIERVNNFDQENYERTDTPEVKMIKSNENLSSTNNYHHVQIVDEDVENFKRKLDILVTNFRTDTLKEFMGIKRNLLVEQRSVIESEKQKCDALVYAKVDEVEHLKDNLTKVKYALNKQSEINDKMSTHILKLKQAMKDKQSKNDIFTKIKNYYLRKKKANKNSEKISQLKVLNYKKKALRILLNIHNQEKMLKITEIKDKEAHDKINEMGKNYNKEISDLRRKLDESNKLIEKYKENKNMLQDNLKKALMRGVVAMNLEAMSILEPDQEGQFNALQSMINLNNITTNTTQIPNIINSNMINSEVNEYKGNNDKKCKRNNSNIDETETHNKDNSFELEQMDKKIIDKDNNWINASSVPLNIKNNLIIKENNNSNLRNSILDEDQIEQPKFNIINNKLSQGILPSQNQNLIFTNNTMTMKIPTLYQNIDYTDELTKNMNFLKNDVESMISYSNNNKSYYTDHENEYILNNEVKNNENEIPSKINKKVVIVNHNNAQNLNKINEIKTKTAESKDKKKLVQAKTSLTTTSSKKVVEIKKK